MFGLTPAPTNRVHVPSGVATHGVALASAGDSPFRSVRIVMALLVPRLRLIPARLAPAAVTAPSGAPTRRRASGAAQKVKFSITMRTATVMAAASSADIAATIIASRQVISS
jgi:hypothetical protein